MESTAMMMKIGRMVRGAIWVVLMGVAMGTLMMWIMMPTNIYRNHWLLSIRKEVNNSTFIGTQGSTLLIYTFPILFLAALSCVYLHLRKKLDDSQKIVESDGKKKELLGRWKRPLLVRAPLGIVSGVELSFFLMFIGLLVWSLWTYLHNNFSKIFPAFFTKDDVKLWQVKLEISGYFLGVVGNIALSFLFFPVTRGSSVLALFGLTSEASIKYHIWLGHIAMVLFTAHGICYIIYWGITHEISEMIKWDFTGISNVAGELSLLAGLILWSTTFPRVRRKMFELFFYTHYLYLLFIFFFILHVGISYSFIMLPGFYLFFVDRYLRFLQSRNRVRLLSSRVLPCDTLELNFAKTPGLKYNPTSTVFMNVPSISKLQWHPFTMSSSSNLETNSLSVVIKNEGAWSQKLYQILSAPNSSIDRLDVSIEGPYGPVSSHFLRHDKLVMVSGGSGITPFFSIIREFIFLSTELKSKTPQLILISAFKKSSDLTILNLLLPVSGTPSDLSNLQLQIEAYVTRETAPMTEDYTKQQRMVWFRPSPTDAPVSAILGPNSWLWLGAVIASSFVMFLALMGIITRYYIYPIDHNTNKHFSASSKAVLHILVMSLCIAAAGSVAVLVNKRRNASDFKQIQNLESSTTRGSLSLRFSDAGVELESLPHQSLVQATNVHYGARPDLKRLLFECKGSSVGVLVCGPRKLRHDVAAICSSGLADNLYFESISFSWCMLLPLDLECIYGFKTKRFDL